MINKFRTFIKDLVLTDIGSHELRQRGLDLLLEEAKTTRLAITPPVRITFNGQTYEVPPDAAAEICYMLHQQKKIQAIKILRSVTGLGLKEAKDAVDPSIGMPHYFHPLPTPLGYVFKYYY